MAQKTWEQTQQWNNLLVHVYIENYGQAEQWVQNSPQLALNNVSTNPSQIIS